MLTRLISRVILITACIQPVALWAQNNNQTFDTFCKSFRSVHSTAFRGFRPWRGASEESDTESFATTIKFPATKSCDIADNEFEYSFTCYWDYEYEQDRESVEDAFQLAQAIRRCMKYPLLDRFKPRASKTLGDGSSFLWDDRVEGQDDHVETSVFVIRSPRKKIGKTREIKEHISLGLEISVDKY